MFRQIGKYPAKPAPTYSVSLSTEKYAHTWNQGRSGITDHVTISFSLFISIYTAGL